MNYEGERKKTGGVRKSEELLEEKERRRGV
jgi:hypothetical protein